MLLNYLLHTNLAKRILPQTHSARRGSITLQKGSWFHVTKQVSGSHMEDVVLFYPLSETRQRIELSIARNRGSFEGEFPRVQSQFIFYDPFRL